MTTTTIRGFRGEYRWLSNFWPVTLTDKNGLKYQSVEHAYQACKCVDRTDREAVRLAATPGEAKKRGRYARLRPGFDALKVDLMLKLLRLKFAPGTELARRLLATGDAELVEENAWGDTFWGECNGYGKNVLGRLLMRVRDELRS